MNAWSQLPPLRELPSPFPKQFLIGIDEQQIDLENGYPTYVRGTWYSDGIWWYYLFGVAAKENLAAWAAAALAMVTFVIFGGRKLISHISAHVTIADKPCCLEQAVNARTRSTFLFCSVIAGCILVVLSVHSRMALNVRYIMPALPPLYLALAIAVVRCISCWWTLFPRLAFIRHVPTFLAALALIETAWVVPYHFSYINPLTGGMYATKLVLHDSNFDGGQDLHIFERAVASRKWGERTVYAFINTSVPLSCCKESFQAADSAIIQDMLSVRDGTVPESKIGETYVLVVSRGFEAPMGWTRIFGKYQLEDSDLAGRLLSHPPDEYLTPSLVVYFSQGQ
jgi:hypothetical protein